MSLHVNVSRVLGRILRRGMLYSFIHGVLIIHDEQDPVNICDHKRM